MVLNAPATTDSVFVVLDNGNANALSTAGTGGNIITKKEKTQVKWNIAANTGTYTIPLTTATTTTNASESKIPTSVNITGAGVGNGNIKFSSYTDNDDTDNYLSSDYMPSDVTNLNNSSAQDNSANVVNRFWIIDANGYTEKPDVTLSFTYDDDEVTAAGNTVSELDIFPQRWNSTTSSWSDVTLSGTLNSTNNTLSGVTVAKTNFFRSWALVSSVNPLPVELIYFKPECEEKTITIQWTTASEINNDYFVIQKSLDGATWTAVDSIDGAGNSFTEQNYSYQINNHLHEITYFRLKQVDFDNTTDYSDVMPCTCEGLEIIGVYPNPSDGEVNYIVQSAQAGTLTLTITDARGRLVNSNQFEIVEGQNFLKNIIQAEMGKYFISVQMSDGKLYDYGVIMIK
ncbi:T9SS type A sorting domain-containing protein [Flavobacteriales bacterium]|nr:T9SS type A sorting domain-containing protein [Flavobacteriales bacterium]